MSRIDYSKWDKLNYSSSSSGEDDDEQEREKEKTQNARATVAYLENLLLSASSSSSPLWNGLVLHHKDIFVSHVLSKLNGADRYFFLKVNGESLDVLKYAGVNVSKLGWGVYECSSISMLEWAWAYVPWGRKDEDGTVRDQAWFCSQVAETNKLESLKWAREVKHCEWDEETITVAAFKGNLEMLKYCFSEECPYDEEESCKQAAAGGNLDCVRFLFAKVKPSRKTEEKMVMQAAQFGHVKILKYFVEERKIPDSFKHNCMGNAAVYGQIDCLKYLVEDAKVPLNNWPLIANARYFEHHDCLNYLLEKGCPEPTEGEYARFVETIEADAREIYRERVAAS